MTVLGAASIEGRLEWTGCDFVISAAAPLYDGLAEPPDDEVLWLRDNLFFGHAEEQATEVAELARDVGADVVVGDVLLFAAMVGGEASGLPTAALWATLWSVVLRAARLPPGDPYRAFWEAGLPQLNDARVALGLAPLVSVFEQHDRMDLVLLLTLAELDEPGELSPNIRYVGPPLDDPVPAAPPADVVISFSTGHMRQQETLQHVLDGVAKLPLRVAVTLGPAMRGERFYAPENVTIYDELRHGALLPTASVMVTHAGHGTVMAALAHGVPLVCLPMGRDQHQISAHVVRLGCGVAVGSPGEIPDAVRRVTGRPSYRAAAERLGAAIRRTDEDQPAVGALERLATS